jgi:hypothetical protein
MKDRSDFTENNPLKITNHRLLEVIILQQGKPSGATYCDTGPQASAELERCKLLLYEAEASEVRDMTYDGNDTRNNQTATENIDSPSEE